MIAVAIFALVLTFAAPTYRDYVIRAQSSKAIGEIGIITIVIERYRLQNGDNPPPSLAAIDRDWLDPWGAAYVYLNLTGANRGAARKNKNLVPLNTDYDLYSKGPDGDSVLALTAKKSHDDIVRANNGAFIGIAGNY